MPRKSIGETAMTDAERQARYRAARAAGVPVVRMRRPADHRGRARRWTDHVTGLVEAQVEFAAWLESLPDNLQDSATAEALRAICDLDLSELQAIVPPRGFMTWISSSQRPQQGSRLDAKGGRNWKRFDSRVG